MAARMAMFRRRYNWRRGKRGSPISFSPSQRQGYAKEALGALLPALREVYGIGRFHAEIDTRNIASIRLVESLGFECVRRIDHADEFKAPSATNSTTR
jgi:L-amino acid N-acyltransferase YncA